MAVTAQARAMVGSILGLSFMILPKHLSTTAWFRSFSPFCQAE